MKSLFRNLLHTVRSYKTATVLNVAGMSVAFAAFIVIMMQVSYDEGFNRSIPDAERIFRVELIEEDEQPTPVLSRPMIDMFAAQPQVEELGLCSWDFDIYFSVEGDSLRNFYSESIYQVYPSYLDILSFDIVEGSRSSFAAEGDALLPLSMAEAIFGGESPVGKVLQSEHGAYTVKGVYRDFPRNTSVRNDIYCFFPPSQHIDNWGNWSYFGYVKLHSADDAGRLADDFTQLVRKHRGEDDELTSVRLTSLGGVHFRTDVDFSETPVTNRSTVLILVALAFVIIIMAGVNFNNFNMALAPVRIRMFNTQLVLGASRGRLRATLVGEAALTSLASFGLGVLWVWLLSFTPVAGLIDPNMALSAYPAMLAASCAAALAVGVLSGIYPAFYITSFPPVLVLKGSFGLTPRGRRLRNALIGVQFTASLVLIFCAVFMAIQNRYVTIKSSGYDTGRLMVATLNWKMMAQKRVISEELTSFPGVEGVAYGWSTLSSSDTYMSWGREFEGRDISFVTIPVSTNFLEVVGIDVVDGRDFREGDELSRNGKLVMNGKARQAYDLQVGDLIDSMEVVGFIPDIQYTTFRVPTGPMAFYVYGKGWGDNARVMYVRAAAGSDMNAIGKQMRKVLSDIDPYWPLDVRFYDRIFEEAYQKERRLGTLVTLFSLVAIAISLMGVFGMVVFEGGFRAREIGIRKVFGSTVGEVLRLFNRGYVVILGICFVVAVPVAYFILTRWLDNFAERTALHWWVFLLCGAAVMVLTIATVMWQAWRSATVNPVKVLKQE